MLSAMQCQFILWQQGAEGQQGKAEEEEGGAEAELFQHREKAMPPHGVNGKGGAQEQERRAQDEGQGLQAQGVQNGGQGRRQHQGGAEKTIVRSTEGPEKGDLFGEGKEKAQDGQQAADYANQIFLFQHAASPIQSL